MTQITGTRTRSSRRDPRGASHRERDRSSHRVADRPACRRLPTRPERHFGYFLNRQHPNETAGRGAAPNLRTDRPAQGRPAPGAQNNATHWHAWVLDGAPNRRYPDLSETAELLKIVSADVRQVPFIGDRLWRSSTLLPKWVPGVGPFGIAPSRSPD